MKESLDFKNIFKRETKLASYIIICLTIVVISLSYAMFFQVDKNTVNQEVVAGDLTFTYSEGNIISSQDNSICFEPMSDDEASLFTSTCGYEFSVTNTGSLKASYTLKVLPNPENIASDSDLKIILRKRVGNTYEVVESYPKKISNLKEGILLTSELNEKESLVYNAQIYVDESTYHDNNGEVVSYKIEGSGVVHENQNIGIDATNMMVAMKMEESCNPNRCIPLYNATYTNGETYKDTLKKIVFENTMHPYENASEEVDLSVKQDRSVLGYYIPNEDASEYTLYIQANGKIKANPNASYYFSNGSNAFLLEGIENVDTSEVTNMSRMFYRNRLIPTVDLSNFDTSNVTNMSYMFSGMDSLTNLDISNFDTSNVTDMSGMFSFASALTSLDVSHFITSKVTDMSDMFSEMDSLTTLDISNFDTSRVTDMSYMFSGMDSLTTLDISNFDTSRVTDMSFMFSGIYSLTTLDISSFNTSNVTNMSGMFSSAPIAILDDQYIANGSMNLKELDLAHFDTSKVTDMSMMFLGCNNLTNLNINNFNTANVTDMTSMFSYMNSLTSLNLNSFDTSNVKSFKDMFASTPNLNGITFGSKFIRNNQANYKRMFRNSNANQPTDSSWDNLDLTSGAGGTLH